MQKEFPWKDSRIFHQVYVARARYNRGELGQLQKIPPKHISYRYNDYGLPVLHHLQKKYQKINPRFCKATGMYKISWINGCGSTKRVKK